ncbi:MAG: thioredoxin domain-containing protein [Polyangiaceae bacterium]|nr:thioredoxin domain-containing protein [Polyangiaceae bacterium]
MITLALMALAWIAGCRRPAPEARAPRSAEAETLAAVAASDDVIPARHLRVAEPLHSAREPGARPDVQATSDDLPVGPEDPVWGSATAPVTVLQFQDLECSSCAKASRTVEQLQQHYGPDRLRVVHKHNPLPFHSNATPAALAAQAVFELAGAPTFFAFTRELYQRQDRLSDSLYVEVARSLGIDADTLRRHAAGARARAKLQADQALAVRVGVKGTPAFRVNGLVVSGAQSFETFRAIIDAELVEAERTRIDGAPPAAVYARRVQANRRSPAPTGKAASPPPDTTVWRIPVGDSPVAGPSTALVTIIEFADFQCPFSRRAQATLAELLARHPGKLRLVWKHYPLPLHERAAPAALLALEARAAGGDAGFFAAVSALFRSSPALEDADLVNVGGTLGLDPARVERALASAAYRRAIDADLRMVEDFGVTGTPTFYINGRRLSGAQPIDRFEAIVGEELARAEALVARGVAPARIYDHVTKDGRGPAVPETKQVAAPSRANPSRGPARAPIVVQVWSDFECPFCQKVLPTLEALEQAYPGQVRVVWRNLPLAFHARARRAAQAAMEAFAQKGDAGFWRMHGRLYQDRAALERSDLERHAAELGLDLARFAAALDGGAHEAQIAADEAEARRAGITATPSFVINGYFLAGAQPLASFKRVVDYALAHPLPRPPAR